MRLTTPQRRLATALALAGALALPACGGGSDGPAHPGTDPGTASAVLLDDDRSGGDTLAAPVLRGRVEVQLSPDGETWVPLAGPDSLAFTLQRGDSALVARDEGVPGDVYQRIRLVFHDATVELRGADLPEEERGEGPLVLRLAAAGEARVEKRVDAFAVGGAATAHIRLELNSAAWVTVANVEGGAVSEALLQAALQVRVLTDGG